MNNDENKHSWKNLAITACDAGVKSITIDFLGSLITDFIAGKIVPANLIINIPISFTTYFVRGIARDYVDYPIVEENLGTYNNLLPYAVGAIVGGLKTELKFKTNEGSKIKLHDADIFKSSVSTLAYELSTDYVNQDTLFKSFMTILTVEESMELIGSKIFDVPTHFSDAAKASLIYAGIINYVYLPIASYCATELDNFITNMGSNDASIINEL